MDRQTLFKILAIDFGTKLESKLLDGSFLFVRISVALTMLLSHGHGKLQNFSNMAPNFLDPLGLGSTLSLALVIGSEFFGSILLALGLLTRWSAFSLLFTMLVAAFIVHGPDPFKAKELAFIYALFFLLFTVAGGGRYSMDHYLKKIIS